MSRPTLARDGLDVVGLIMADRAFLDSQKAGATTADSVRAALLAYVEQTATPQAGAQPVTGGMTQHLASLPDDHTDLPGGQVLVRSFDGGDSWQVCTRPDHHSTWSRGTGTVSA